MQKIEDVIILGAGASKSEGAPLQKDLFKEFFSYIYDENNNQNKINKSKIEILNNFFENFWGINISEINDIEFPTFEECLGILDLAYMRGECFKGYNKNKLINIKNTLIFTIAKILDTKLRNTKEEYHKKLINRLKNAGFLKKTAFISLNYDIIIDNALVDLYPDFHLDYGIDFYNYYSLNKKKKWEKPDKNKSILLLKPHGSLNWLYCPVCNHIELTHKEKKAIKAFHKRIKCDKCGMKSMEPVIIPPTYYKDMLNPFIQEIYLKCDKILRDAKRIFVCGYSFPDADLHIKYLLKRAELFIENTPEIYIINGFNGKSEEEKRNEENRIKKFFKNKNKIFYTDLSFEYFAENEIEF